MFNKNNIADVMYNSKNHEAFYHCLGSLVSSMSIRTTEDCDNSITALNEIKTDLEKSKIIDKETKDEWLGFIEQGLQIIERDKKEFESNGGRRASC